MSNLPLTMPLLVSALADMLHAQFPDVPIYANPNQQGTEPPCWFVVFQPLNRLEREIGRHFYREIAVDLVYEEPYNLPDLLDRYYAAAERVEAALYRLHYTVDVGGREITVPLQIKEREWSVSNEALHYKFQIRARVLREEPPAVKMDALETLQGGVKE